MTLHLPGPRRRKEGQEAETKRAPTVTSWSNPVVKLHKSRYKCMARRLSGMTGRTRPLLVVLLVLRYPVPGFSRLSGGRPHPMLFFWRLPLESPSASHRKTFPCFSLIERRLARHSPPVEPPGLRSWMRSSSYHHAGPPQLPPRILAAAWACSRFPQLSGRRAGRRRGLGERLSGTSRCGYYGRRANSTRVMQVKQRR